MGKNTDEQIRKKCNRKLLRNGFKTEFINNLKNIINADNKKLSFFQFLMKHSFIIIIGLVPTVIDFIKTGSFEVETFICSLLAILILMLCIWGVSKIQLK